MQRIIFAGIAVAALTLSACNNNNTPPLTGSFRVVNGVADSNSSGLTADIANVSTGVNNIVFGTASGGADIPVGSYDAQLTVNGVTFSVDNVNLSNDSVTTVYAHGTVGTGGSSSTATGFPVQESLNAPPSGQFVVQYVDDSAIYPSVNVYLIAPGASINGINPTATLNPTTQFSAPAAINNGSYEIVVTNSTGNVIFDSGNAANAGISLPDVKTTTNANVLQIAIIDPPASAPNGPVSLLVLDNAGGNTPISTAAAE